MTDDTPMHVRALGKGRYAVNCGVYWVRLTTDQHTLQLAGMIADTHLYTFHVLGASVVLDRVEYADEYRTHSRFITRTTTVADVPGFVSQHRVFFKRLFTELGLPKLKIKNYLLTNPNPD